MTAFLAVAAFTQSIVILVLYRAYKDLRERFNNQQAYHDAELDGMRKGYNIALMEQRGAGDPNNQ